MSTLRYHLRLYLVRHGESTNNALTRLQGYEAYMLSRSNDPLLSPTGLTQAEEVAPLVARLLDQDRAQLATDGADAPCTTAWRSAPCGGPCERAAHRPGPGHGAHRAHGHL